MLDKCKTMLKRLWNECKNVETLALFFLVVIVLYTPAWGGLFLYAVTGQEWYLAGATSYVLFWAGPFTPFFPLCLAITLGLRRLFLRRASRRSDDGDPPPDD